MGAELVGLAAASTDRYNEDAAELEELTTTGDTVSQITVPAGAELADQLSTDARRIAASIELGALAMLSRLTPERGPRPRLAAALGAV